MEKEDKLNKDMSISYGLKSEDSGTHSDSINHGEIKIRQNKTRRKIRYVIKGISFVLIAAISGSISASYIIEKKYSKLFYGTRNNSVIYSNREDVTGNIKSSLPKNEVNNVVENLSPMIVGVSTNQENFSGNDITKSVGSGIIFDSNGYIVTNSNLVNGSDKIYVKLSSYGARPMEAKLIGCDKISDLAVIKVEAENLPAATFADSDKVRAGDLSIAVGNPLGEEVSTALTVGIISVINRKIDGVDPITSEKSSYKILKTDANINAYNTGGPLCNSLGEIIGINSMALSKQYPSDGMSVAIASNEAQHIIQSLTSYGKVKKPHLGFVGQSVGRISTSEVSHGIEGVYVREVSQGESLANAGVKPTDIIVELDNKPIKKFVDIQPILDEHKLGDTITGKIWRDGNVMKIDITLTEKE